MKAEKWLDLVKHKPVAFGHEAGFKDLTEINNQWIKNFILRKEDQTLQAHRGSYKTTSLSIAIALMMVLLPDLALMFMRKTDDDVKEVIQQIAKLLDSKRIKQLVHALYKIDLQRTKTTAFEIDTNVKIGPRGASQLLGLGSGGSITGKHYDIIITDDIINLNDRISKADRDKTKLVYQELQNVKNRGGRFINCGTPWHKEDAFTLMPNIEKWDCYSTGLMSEAEIQNMRSSLTPSLFAANYELKHIAPEKTLFDLPIIDDGNNTELIYNGVCHIDAAYGGSDGSAFTIAKKLKDGRIFVYGLLKQKHVDDCLEEFEQKRKLFRAGTLYNETNADKGYLIRKIEGPTSSYHERQNKHIKISTYLYRNWKDIVFIKGTDPDYINQILDYTENAEHDDAPDSLASLLRVIDKDKTKINKTEMINNLKRMGL